MASFEQNQQDQVNMNNTLDQIKQFNAECDKATAALRAADLEAEEELLGVRLKNLTKAQQAKLTQLGQLLELEEKGIQELAKLRLTLSNRQFAIRKQEIQKEFQLYKAEAESFFKSISKYKVTMPAEAPKKASTAGDIKASTKNKSADVAIQKASRKVKIATYGVDKVSQDITEAVSSLQELAEATVATSNKNRQAIENRASTVGSNNPSTEVKAEAQKEKDFSNDSKGMERADEGKFSFTDIIPALDAIQAVQQEELAVAKEGKQAFDFSSVIRILDSINKKGENGNSQTTLDLAGKLVEQTKEAEKSITKLRELNENRAQNMRLIQLTETQKLNKAHADAEYKVKVDKATAYAKKLDLQLNKETYLAEEEHKLRISHITKQNDLSLAAIKADEKAKDLARNADKYAAEAKAALENTFAETQNKLVEDRIKTEEALAFTNANKKELLDQEIYKLQTAHTEAEQKARLDLINAEAKAKDLEFNEAKYRAEAQNALKLAHEQEQNKLTEDIIKAEEKRNDLIHNKKLYDQEEEDRLNKALIDDQNKLTEDFYKTQKSIAFTQAHEDEIRAIEHQKLINQHATDYDKYLKDILAADEKAKDLEHNHAEYLNKELDNLERGHKEEQNKLTQDLINAEAKGIDLRINKEQYITEEKARLDKEFADKNNKLTQAAIDNDAKAADLQDNADQYKLEAWKAHENEFYAERNRRMEESFAIEQGILWDKAHIDEVMAEEVHKKQMGFTKEYGDYQRKAGKYAIDPKEFEKNKARKDRDTAKKDAVGGIFDGLKKFGTGEFSMTDIKESASKYMGTRTAELQADGMSEAGAKTTAALEMVAEAAGSLAKTLDAKVKEISSMQGIVDTRLQGSQTNERDFGNGSYWNQLLEDAKKIAGASPFIRQDKLVDNIKTLVEKGISFDIKQRAFLMTIQEKIANTFDAADGTLLRLIRIQQQDTTAGRLGMESALNSFLNSMYETSEYLESVAKSVRSSLEEMQALMEGAAGTELEFQVQKWMGSLYSVGMSDSAVQGIAQAFGQIASGDVSGLTGSGAGNLIIMAANEAGKSIADILQEGLDAKETNELMQAMVNYLAEIAATSSDSRVVQQQLANVYGLKASDLRAATNLASSVKDISKKDLTYDGMMKQLEHMMNTIRFRTSIGEGLTNMWDNVMYSMASTQASNPILYLLPKMANLLKDITGGDGGGIPLPFLNVMGFGADLRTSVADLMLLASLGGTALGTLGPAITGLADLVNPLVGSSMLMRAGIKTSGSSKIPVLARGTAQPLQHLGGASISESGYVGNSSGDDVKNATLQDAADSKKKQMVEAKDEESADDIVIKAQQAAVDIYNLLEEVAHGSQSLRVRVINSGYGAPGGGNNGGNNAVENEGNGDVTAGTPGARYGTDNGNWVLSF